MKQKIIDVQKEMVNISEKGQEIKSDNGTISQHKFSSFDLHVT